jgi:hypothetical protein
MIARFGSKLEAEAVDELALQGRPETLGDGVFAVGLHKIVDIKLTEIL